MELKDTIAMMQSDDYKERFKAEYHQVKIRYDKLNAMTVKYEAGTLDFTPSCSLELLLHQKSMMGQYLHDLEVRAEIEGINLNVDYVSAHTVPENKRMRCPVATATIHPRCMSYDRNTGMCTGLDKCNRSPYIN